MRLVLALAAAGVLSLAGTADASTPTKRAVTLVTTHGTFRTVIGPVASVMLVKSTTGSPVLLIRRGRRVSATSAAGFRRLVISEAAS